MRIPAAGRTAKIRPPGPRGEPVVGNLRAYESDRLGFLMDVADRYGGIASFDSRTSIVSDVVLADQVLRDPSRVFEIPHNILGHRLNSDDLDAVLRIRTLLSPTLRARAVLAAQGAAAVRADHILARVGDDWFDPSVLAEDVISGAVARLFLGEDGERLRHAIASLLDALEVVIGNVFAMPASWKTPAQRRIERRHRRLKDAVCSILERRRRLPADDVASVVVTSAPPFSEEALADMLIGSLLAAQRVPAAGASWLLMLVSERPTLQTELRAEADRFRHNRVLGNAEPPSAYPRTLACILEALRLYPPTWLITRTSRKPVSLGGYQLPPHHNVMISPYVLHRNPAIWRSPRSFMPERWVDRRGQHASAFLAFGRGRHRCPGQDLISNCLTALLLTMVGDRRIIRHPGPVVADPRVTLKPVGLRIALS